MTAAEKQYGDALYALAVEEHCEDEVLDGLTAAAKAFAENPAYLRLVQDPALPKEERLGLLDEAFGESVHVYVGNLLKILCGKSALGLTKGCLEEYRARLYEARGILPVQAVSAVKLTAPQQKKLKEQLSAKTGKTILLDNVIDPTLLGGIKLRYEGKELDGTAAGRLAAMRRALTEA